MATDDESRHVPTREGYDLWASHYDVDGNPLIAIEEPHVDRLLGDVRGMEIADIGCGTGRHTVRLASRGARVTALDFSTGMLEQARRKPGADGVLFIAHDIAASLPLQDHSVDRVLCALVLDHVKDVPSLFAELSRICHPAPRGRIVISVMHPAMMLRGVQARFTDPRTGLKTYPASVPNQISDYVLAAGRVGLRIDQMSEHSGDSELAQRVPRMEPYIGWPLLLMMSMSKG
jgi:2-polyprenyl-3-methyl-5-hydroxy-6-metoxy-1,4-benzoquinol methylase